MRWSGLGGWSELTDGKMRSALDDEAEVGVVASGNNLVPAHGESTTVLHVLESERVALRRA